MSKTKENICRDDVLEVIWLYFTPNKLKILLRYYGSVMWEAVLKKDSSQGIGVEINGGSRQRKRGAEENGVKKKKKQSQRRSREGLSAGCFDFILLLSATDKRDGAGMWRCGAPLMNGPVCPGLLPVRVLPLELIYFVCNTNGLHSAQPCFLSGLSLR